MQWVSALGSGSDLADALAEGIDQLMDGLVDVPDLVFVFVAPARRGKLAAVGRALRSAWPAVRVVGCTGASALADGSEPEGQPCVALLAGVLPGVSLTLFHLSADGLPPTEDAAGWRVALGIEAPPAGVVLLTDPYSCPAEGVLAGLAAALPGCPVVGGLASGGQGPGGHRLFLDDDVHPAGAVGVALGGALRFEAVVAQGCKPVGQPLFVTSAERHILRQLDGKPATEVAQAVVAALGLADQALARRSLALGLGIAPDQERYGQGDFLVRNLVGADPEAGALVVGAALRPQQVVQFHVRDAVTSARELEDLLLAAAHAGPVAGALLFTCLGRGAGLYGQHDHDSSLLRAVFGEAVPVAGFFCNGELGPVGPRSFLHGYTSVLALLRPPAGG